jgi:transposase
MQSAVCEPRSLLGIDMSKASFHVHLLRSDERTFSHQFDNNPPGFKALSAWLAKHEAGAVKAAVEATGNYALPLMLHLVAANHEVSYLNPRRVKDFSKSLGRKAKTDPIDAKLIALFIQRLHPRPWTPPAAELTALQALLRHRDDLVREHTAMGNRLKTASSKEVQASLKRVIKTLDKEIKTADKQIQVLVLDNTSLQKDSKLLRSIPGFGTVNSLTVLAEVPHLATFERARDAAAFAGVTPCVQQSGMSVRCRGRMSKEGSAPLRKALYMAALNVISRANPLREFYLQMVARGKSKACALGALMNKLMRIAYGVIKHQTPFVANLAKANPAT